MIRLVLLVLFLGLSSLGFSQTESAKKTVTTQVQTPDKAKKVGISSASRRSSLPNQVPKNSNGGVKGQNMQQPGSRPDGPNGPGGMQPNRSNIRIPKARPVGPITRPGAMPRSPKSRPPGS